MSCSSEAVCDSKKPDLVPVQTKPHYWLYKQGREVWNRWAREAFFDKNGKDDGRIDKLIAEAKEKLAKIEKSSHLHKEDGLISIQEEKIEALEKFKEYKVLTIREKNEIEQEMISSSGIDDLELPSVHDNIDFLKTDWNEEADFSLYIFPAKCDFRSASFLSYADFSSASFSSAASFSYASFSSYADFSSASFCSYADFSSASFPSYAYFSSASFCSYADFSSANFSSDADFSSAKIDFLSIHKTNFESDCNFQNAIFEKVPKVSGVSITGVFNFYDVTLPDIKGSSNPVGDTLSYSQLKRLMNDSHLHDWETFFFRKELLSRAEAAKRKSKKTFDSDWRTHKFIHLYDTICECGNSIVKPLKGLLALFLSMVYFYPFLAGKFKRENLMDSFYIEEGIYLSLRHTVLFLPSSKKNYDSVMESLFAAYGTGNVDMLYIIYVLSSGLQTLLSIGLLFLIGLAIRNHLKIK
ncbi:MAG: hypothetical protein PQ612_01585 [Rickettsiales bacterium]|nr:hypothetical protein [Pseudomonadota bacterium]MDA0965392.1 hypothetical protein [Pseudomonadota bacterium]MDG4544320.1 hypothetical protein [Rickettsiales bacterium]MDG4544835.1 hypothetical protein [Rickettsiales bacterium]MDG4546957.1 hypothetical protein [Rickettsiales bacterium]